MLDVHGLMGQRAPQLSAFQLGIYPNPPPVSGCGYGRVRASELNRGGDKRAQLAQNIEHTFEYMGRARQLPNMDQLKWKMLLTYAQGEAVIRPE